MFLYVSIITYQWLKLGHKSLHPAAPNLQSPRSSADSSSVDMVPIKPIVFTLWSFTSLIFPLKMVRYGEFHWFSVASVAMWLFMAVYQRVTPCFPLSTTIPMKQLPWLCHSGSLSSPPSITSQVMPEKSLKKCGVQLGEAWGKPLYCDSFDVSWRSFGLLFVLFKTSFHGFDGLWCLEFQLLKQNETTSDRRARKIWERLGDDVWTFTPGLSWGTILHFRIL